jgi:DhnA family fructose-bisphosphate aldolase class Ia
MTVQLAIEGNKVGIPLIVDLQLLGPRIVLRSKAIELGVSFALEGSADGIAIPWPGEESFKTVVRMAAEVPVWVKVSPYEKMIEELNAALDLGAVGPWFNERLFSKADPGAILVETKEVVHASALDAV